MVPHTADVTNVLWYNVPLLAEHGITPPTTWEELLAACDTLIAAGVIPIASGNKDLWAAGNWLAPPRRRASSARSLRRGPRRHRQVRHARVGAGVRLHRGAARPRVRQRERQRHRRQRGRAAVLPGQGRDAPHRVVAGELGDRRGAGPRLRLRQPARRCPTGRPATRAASSASRPATWSTPRAPTSSTRRSSWRSSTAPANVKRSSRRGGRCPIALSRRRSRRGQPVRCAWATLLNEAPAVVLPAGHGLRPRDRRRAVRGGRRGARWPGDPGRRARRASTRSWAASDAPGRSSAARRATGSHA